MKNKDYWKKRFEQLENASHQKGVEFYQNLDNQFVYAESQIDKEIRSWYQRFAINNNVSIAEAKKMLSKQELKELKWTVNEYIKYGEENALDGMFMKQLENASARYHISRLEALKLNTQCIIEKLYGNQTDKISDFIKDIYSDNMFHTMYELQKGFNVGWNFSGIDEKRLEKLISKPWAVDGVNFSERIWTNKKKLMNELNNELTSMCLTGKSPDKAVENIAKKMKVAKSRAKSIVYTESSYFQSQSDRDTLEKFGCEKYEIVATLDSHTSEVCQSMDGTVFDLKDYEVGVSAPPFHPYCRTVIVPAFEDDFIVSERAARDEETGKTYFVPDNITYPEWKKAFVDGDHDGFVEVSKEGKKHFSKSKPKVEKTKLLNKFGEEITFDFKNNDDKYSLSNEIIEKLSNQYNTRLQRVTIGAEKAGGDVQISGAVMRLNSTQASVAIHEFAHTLANSNADKYKLTNDVEFWKEIKKVYRQYHKDVDKLQDSSRWISSYEHSSRKIDEFMAEAFTHAKLRELGIDVPSRYGDDYTYSQKVLDIVDKYFKKDIIDDTIKVKKEVLDINNFPNAFTSKREINNTQTMIDYINNLENVNDKVLKLYNNMGKMENIETQGIPFKITHGKNDALSLTYNSYSKEIVDVKLNIPKLTGDNLNGQIGTTLHEEMHYIDFMNRKDTKTYSSYFSTQQKGLVDVVRKKNDYVGEEAIKIFNQFKDEYKNISNKLYQEYQTKINELTDDYVSKFGTARGSSFTLPTQKYKELNKLTKKLRTERDSMIDYEIRNAMGGNIGNLQDIYDALSGGSLRDRGKVLFGHGSRYYMSIDSRVQEIVANYASLSITRPDLIEILKKDYPQLVDELDKYIDELLKKVGV